MIIKDIIAQVPTHIFWKDLDSRYKGCNESFLLSAGLSRMYEVINKTDVEIWGQELGQVYVEGDKIALESGVPFQRIESLVDSKGKEFDILVTKKPWLDAYGNKIGIVGCTILLTAKKEDQQNDEKLLSAMQKKCLVRIALGMSAKQIAYDLKLSQRTVEHYIQIIKIKLKCFSRYDLIKKALTFKSITDALKLIE